MQKLSEALLRCNSCGFCLAECPVYKVTGIEWTAARGRLALIRSALEGELKLSELAEPLFNCLGCNACVDHCPPQVMTDDIVLKARAELVREQGQSWIQRLVFHTLLPNPSRLRRSAQLLGWLQASGLWAAARGLGLIGLMGDAGKAGRILPQVDRRQPMVRASPKLEHPKYRVAYFVGCATTYLAPHVARAAIRVLNRHGVELVEADFTCCGMPPLSYGDRETALMLAKKNTDLARSLEVDAIITTCATCGSLLKRYPDLLAEAPGYPAQARAMAGKVRDISEFLADIGLNREMGTLKHRVTYHDPCHLGRFQKATRQPRQILQSIPGIDFVEMPESNMCCGAAGSYSLGHYELSMKVLERKMENVAKTDAELLVTCCPGCSLQLAHGARERGMKVRAVELVELLDRAYRSAC
ncbi:MAG: (Fe-S)-binding protein [Chloroflexota bacterium]|nr:(Fe-S)-binding protein [Chloroflexota bacterium]